MMALPIMGLGKPAPQPQFESEKQPELALPQETVQFSSHPLSRFTFGKWKFINGLMTLTAEEAKEFEAQWFSQPAPLQRMVQKINVENAEATLKKLIESNRAQAGSIQSGISTTANSELPPVDPNDPASADSTRTV